jgi:hypothetical protein
VIRLSYSFEGQVESANRAISQFHIGNFTAIWCSGGKSGKEVAKKKSSDLGLTTQFDYLMLASEQRAIVQQRTGEIRERLQRSAQDIWEIGQGLADVRAQLKHGQFEAWLKAEFGWSRRTAYNFINVYETFQERANLAQIDIATSALYLLAAPSTPPELRQQYLQEAKAGKKVTHQDLRQTIERERKLAGLGAQTGMDKADKPEIITLIPRAQVEAIAAAPVIDVVAQAVDASPKLSADLSADLNVGLAGLSSGWYLLDQQHLVFCGDTALPDFYSLIPAAAFAFAATGEDWDHDWLVEAAKSVTVLPETDLQSDLLEQLLNLFSQPQDTVIFPWLPQPDMIAIAHRLGRKVVAGDLSPERCYRAIQEAGLKAVKLVSLQN